MTDTKESKKPIVEGQTPEENPTGKKFEDASKALKTVEVNPDAFAGLEQAEVSPVSAPEKEPVIIPPVDLAPDILPAEVGASDVVVDNVASITRPGASLDSYKHRLEETLAGMKRPAASAYESADWAAKLLEEQEAGK